MLKPWHFTPKGQSQYSLWHNALQRHFTGHQYHNSGTECGQFLTPENCWLRRSHSRNVTHSQSHSLHLYDVFITFVKWLWTDICKLQYIMWIYFKFVSASSLEIHRVLILAHHWWMFCHCHLGAQPKRKPFGVIGWYVKPYLMHNGPLGVCGGFSKL